MENHAERKEESKGELTVSRAILPRWIIWEITVDIREVAH